MRPRPRFRAVRPRVAISLLFGLVSCGDALMTSPPPTEVSFRTGPHPRAANLELVSGDGQSDSAGAPLADSLVVRVVDSKGRGVNNADVTFEVLDGGGSLSPARTTTDSDGLAAGAWTLGTDGAQRSRASLTYDSLTFVQFEAELQVASATVRLDPDSVLLWSVGDSSRLILTVGEDTTTSADWLSRDSAVATVSSSGNAGAVGSGRTWVLANTSQGSDSTMVEVALPVVGVDVLPADTTLNTGGSLSFTAEAYDETGELLTDREVTWSSSDETVIQVDAAGKVTAVGEGSAEVRATLDDVTGSAAATVRSSDEGGEGGQTVTPELPRVFLETGMPSVSGSTITVASGGDLQAAIDAAQPGDEIVLAAGATFTGAFTLPDKGGTDWIVIRTDTDLPPEGTRMTPAAAGNLATLEGGNANSPVLRTAPGAAFYRIVGVEIRAVSSVTSLTALVSLDGNQMQESEIPHDLVLDRIYVHGHSSLDLRRCVLLNGARSAVIDSYVSECHSNQGDAQAILGFNGPGPFKIVNNFLEGSGENVMFGGADPSIEGLRPMDIEIRGNHFYKPPEWFTSDAWSVKNLFELKNAGRILIEGNVFENNWSDSQTGFAILLKSANQSGGCTWCETSDVTFRFNRIENVTGGFNLSSHGDRSDVVPMNTVLIHDNLLVRVGTDSDWGSAGDKRGFQVLHDIRDLEFSNNTMILPTNGATAAILSGTPQAQNVVILNNITVRGNYGWFGDGVGEGTVALETYFDPWIFAGNIVIAAPKSAYPAGNFFPASNDDVGFVSPAGGNWALASDSPFAGAGTDGENPGLDFYALEALLTGVR